MNRNDLHLQDADDDIFDDSSDVLINDITADDLISANKLDHLDITKEYKLDHPDMNIFSPQIEVFSPFSAHVDASRTNMSAKQLLQLVTSENNDVPFLLNKNYRSLTDINSPFVEYAADDGIVIFSHHEFLIIYYNNLTKILPFYLPKGKKLVNNALTLRYQIGTTDEKTEFKKGETLFDYTGQTLNNHIPKVGYRANVMFAQFYGYTADDGFVMSDTFANKTTISYYEKVFIPISKEIKYFQKENGSYFYGEGDTTPNVLCQYLKIDTSSSFLSEVSNTTKKISKFFGKSVKSLAGGKVVKIKVHKLNKNKTFNELESEYIYTRGMIEEILEIYKAQLGIKGDMFNTLKNVLIEEKAIDFTNKLFSQWESTTKLPVDTMKELALEFEVTPETIDIVLEFEIIAHAPSDKGDKFANTYAGKGECSLVIPEALMPKDEFGRPADIVFNPLGSFGRNNWGTMFELGFSKIIHDMEDCCKRDEKDNFIKRLDLVNEHFIKITDTEYYDKISDLIHMLPNDNIWVLLKTDIINNGGLYFFADTFPGIKFKQYVEEFLLLYEKRFNCNIVGKQKTKYSKELMQWMRDRGFVSSAFGKDIVEDINQEVYFGFNYWIKLYHTSESKYNSVGFANFYSAQTGDPKRGAKNKGGQHFSWQSVIGWEGHKKGTAIKKELFAIKSSAVKDKNNFILKMTKDGEYNMKPTYSSPTTTTLNCYLAMMMMRFDGFEPAYLDDTHLVKAEIDEDDEYNIELNEIVMTVGDEDDYVDTLIETEDEEEVEDDSEFSIEDLFEVGSVHDVKTDHIEIEDDLGD